MATLNKYQRQKQQYSNDGGQTWFDVVPANYRRGSLIEEASEDCNTTQWVEVQDAWYCVGNTLETRWIMTENVLCDGTDSYYVEKEQESTDGGVTWTDTDNTRLSSEIYEYDSDDCETVSIDYAYEYLTLESVEDGNTITYFPKDVQVSTNKITWTPLSTDATATITIEKGEKLYLKRNVNIFTCDNFVDDIMRLDTYGLTHFQSKHTFESTGGVKIYGNIFSLYMGDDFTTYYQQADKSNIFVICDRMFYNDENIKVVSVRNLVFPEGPAYHTPYMFSQQHYLTNVPKSLPLGNTFNYYLTYHVNASTTMTTRRYSNCYSMFAGCDKIKKANITITGDKFVPVYDYINVEQYGTFQGMFSGCTSLVEAPKLPSLELGMDCYLGMFSGCTSLQKAPDLPATVLVKECYKEMFYNCSLLNEIKVLAQTNNAVDALKDWMYNVPTEGTFTYNPVNTQWELYSSSSVPYKWLFTAIEENYVEWRTDGTMCLNNNLYTRERKYVSDDDVYWVATNETRQGILIEEDSTQCATDYSLEYLTTQMLGNGTISISTSYSNTTPLLNIYYSLNDGEWISYKLKQEINVLSGDIVKWKALGEYNHSTRGSNDYAFFISTCDYNVYGNVKSIVDGDDFLSEDYVDAYYAFNRLFARGGSSYRAALISAKNLVIPSNLQGNGCTQMFWNQVNMTAAPKTLYGATATSQCYREMFRGCTSLIATPKIMATTLGANSCERMFYDCTSLQSVTWFKPQNVSVYSCAEMFYNCSSLSNISNLSLEATDLATGCYEGMFKNCVSLVTAPVLPAITPVENCYAQMFSGCALLNYINCQLEALHDSNSSSVGSVVTDSWINSVQTRSGTFVYNCDNTAWQKASTNNGIPANWETECI